MTRSADISRRTNETDIDLSLTLDAVARHGKLDLDVKVEGDLETGPHHGRCWLAEEIERNARV